MSQKIKNLLQSKGENYIFPFFWIHGEEESVLREYMEAIHSSGIGAVCVESRPHPDYCGPQWWHDLDIILDEAKKREMKVWILDDSHFPTGYANGALEDAPAELCRQFLYYSSVEIVGPAKSAQLNISKHAKHMRNPLAGSIFSRDQKERRKFDDDQMLSISAARVDQEFDASTLIDLTDFVEGDELVWDVPEGRWKIYVNYLTRNAGTRDSYINLLNKRSARKQIDAVYEPHFEHYKEEFGKTIAGFFSDEPELGNGQMNVMKKIGEDQDLPWSQEVEEQLLARLGSDWKTKLPMLWENGRSPDQSAEVRFIYMDIITRLVEENFSNQIGNWCEERGVEYIGHIIEDNNSHSRLGSSLGHFFRGLSGQHMSGIDNIGGQVFPAGEAYPKKGLTGDERDGEFFHYMLGKLGSSFAAIDPKKQGRTMVETFGAYGWSEGVRMMKYLLDHFLVRGVNRYVPHAFSAKDYPDPDCPPHFYAHGHNPQFRHFGALMEYLNRMCALISDGKRVTPVAILYHAEAEWTGDYMLNQKPARVLMDNQIDFDILPADVFTERKRYQTKIDNLLRINSQDYKTLIIPYSQYITESMTKAVIELKKVGFPVLFIDDLPSGIVDGDDALLAEISDCKIVTLDTLKTELDKESISELKVEPAFSMLRYLHYKEDNDTYIFTNENMAETFTGTVTVPNTGPLYGYDVWNNELYEVHAEQKGQGTTLHLEIPPYQSVVIIFGKLEDTEIKAPISYEEEINITDNWKMSISKSIDYPAFTEEQQITKLENVGLKYPEFSGFIRYEKEIEVSSLKQASLIIEDAFEGVEVFVNDESVGIQVAPPFAFDISKQIKSGTNKLRIEVATTLEREQHYTPVAPDHPYAAFAAFAKDPLLQPTGIVGDVKLLIQK